MQEVHYRTSENGPVIIEVICSDCLAKELEKNTEIVSIKASREKTCDLCLLWPVLENKDDEKDVFMPFGRRKIAQ